MIIFIYHQSVNKANNNINPSVKSALYKLFLSLVGIVQSLGSVQIFCNPMDYCLPGSSVHGISQVRILEQVAISFSREIFLTQVLNLHLLHLAGRFFTAQPPWQSTLFKHHQFQDISLYYSYSFIRQMQKFLTPQMSCPCNLLLLISSRAGYLSQGQSMLRKELVAHTDVLFPDKL